jgi:hypothetical protein
VKNICKILHLDKRIYQGYRVSIICKLLVTVLILKLVSI